MTQDEYIASVSDGTSKLHTGPNGENPGGAPDIDAETNAPKQKGKRTKRNAAATKAAIADALGVSADSDKLDDIDTDGLDAEDDK